MKSGFLIILFFLTGVSMVLAGGVQGTIRTAKGEPMPYASILVKNTSFGTMANADGQYEINLNTGSYEIQFQYVGYQTLVKVVEIGTAIITLDVTLAEEVVQLNEVKVGTGNEDPAYTIMRKSISMARFHMLEVDSWSARTYVKGTFQVLDIPFLLKGTLKKNNIEVGTTYVLESINEISFKQPNTIREKVVSIRSNLPPGTKPAINFAQLNLYRPNFLEVVSPLSPKAFAYYRFAYEGGFEDRGHWINRIRVIPRTRGQDTFEGTLYIVDNLWSIHSFHFSYIDENSINYQVQQIYSPVQDVWMPIQSEAKVSANLFGAKGEARYVTSARNYQLKVNPKYHQQPVVVDEKIDKEKAAAAKKQTIDPSLALQQKELTRKQLRKLVKNMEKEDRKDRKEKGEDVHVVRDYAFDIDTLARKKTASFWEEERQVPLTDIEVKGYKQADSLYKANGEKIKKDSIRNLPAFRVRHLIFGKTYLYGKETENEGYPTRLEFDSPIFHINNLGFFNTVEGYVLRSRAKYTHRIEKDLRWSLEANARYSFARNHLNGGLTFYRGNLKNSFQVVALRNVFQFNAANPISEAVNTVYTLLREENYLKLYEKTAVGIQWYHRFIEPLTLTTAVSYEQRTHLTNYATRGWVDRESRAFSSNDPENQELNNQTAFPDHQVWLWTTAINFQPFAKAAIYNGRRYRVNNNSPILTLYNRSGFGDTRFNQLELRLSDRARLLKADFEYLVKGGTFYGPEKPQYLMDFKNFNGNQTIFQTGGLENFRLLEYYKYSTTQSYLEAHASWQPQRLLFTYFTPLRLYGIQENIFVNTLFSNQTQLYEVGYGFKGLVKLFGAEVVTTFQDGKYVQTGVRVRLAIE